MILKKCNRKRTNEDIETGSSILEEHCRSRVGVPSVLSEDELKIENFQSHYFEKQSPNKFTCTMHAVNNLYGKKIFSFEDFQNIQQAMDNVWWKPWVDRTIEAQNFKTKKQKMNFAMSLRNGDDKGKLFIYLLTY